MFFFLDAGQRLGAANVASGLKQVTGTGRTGGNMGPDIFGTGSERVKTWKETSRTNIPDKTKRSPAPKNTVCM